MVIVDSHVMNLMIFVEFLKRSWCMNDVKTEVSVYIWCSFKVLSNYIGMIYCFYYSMAFSIQCFCLVLEEKIKILIYCKK